MAIALDQLRPMMYGRTSANKRPLRDDGILPVAIDGGHGREVVSEWFHENSKFRERTAPMIPDDRDQVWTYVEARTTPDYPGNRLVPLPDPSPVPTRLVDALRGRRSRVDYGESPVPIEDVSALLGYACGVTASVELEADLPQDPAMRYRAYPSPGALYPVEIYPLVTDCEGLDEGVYYYLPEEHALRLLRAEDGSLPARVADLFAVEPIRADSANLVVVLTASFRRVIRKYGDRGYRYALQESGHLAQNLQLVAEALGLNSAPIGGFYDDAVNDFLHVDGVNEAAVYVITVGTRPGRSA